MDEVHDVDGKKIKIEIIIIITGQRATITNNRTNNLTSFFLEGLQALSLSNDIFDLCNQKINQFTFICLPFRALYYYYFGILQ
jgi:hypothetical protein